jgi:hypothetical protein
MMRVALITAALAWSTTVAHPLSLAAGKTQPTVLGTFVGTTPCDDAIRSLLQLPVDAKADLIEWELTLHQAPAANSGTPSYQLRYAYGPAVPNRPGLAADAPRRQRSGSWTRSTGTGITLYRLSDGLSLQRISDNIFHVLNTDGSLMVGNGGWSYTLGRRDALEPAVDPALIAGDPGDEGRTISPLSSGPHVFGVFEGRTPCQAVARVLESAARPGCWKAKWRMTLFQDPQTHKPTTYKLEGTLFRSAAREGQWRVASGTPDDPKATVYELTPSSGQREMRLLKGDDNVLFFLDEQRRPLTGTARNAYTLDRRIS